MHPTFRRMLGAVTVLVLAATGAGGCSGGGHDAAPADPDTQTPSASASTPASFASVVTAVEDRVAVYDGIATGIIVVVRVGDRTRAVTDGLSRVEGKKPIAAGQTFPVASITKPMVATLVLQLVHEGRLALGDDLRGMLPALAGLDTPITLEQVLSHRSGLLRDLPTAQVLRLGPGATAELVEAAARHGLEFAPGTDGRYSNLGFAALGLLVEKVLDQPLGEALAERVFEPAGMDDSALGTAPDIQGYDRGKPVRNYYLEYLPGAGSVVATAGDLDAFFHALWAGRLLPDDLVTSMRESRGQVQIGIGFRPDYGLGLIRWHVSCGTAIGHSGRIGGFTDEAWTLEGHDRSVVVSVNDQDADSIARGIVETALCGG